MELKPQSIKKILLPIVFLMFLFTSCDLTGGDTITTVGVPLAPPVNAKYPLHLQVRSLGDSGEDISLISNLLDVKYGKTNTISTEEVGLKKLNKSATTYTTTLRSWDKGKVTINEYDDATSDNALMGVVTMTVEGSSLLQWLKGDLQYTVDRSELNLVYQLGSDGNLPVLKEVVYNEAYGFGGDDKLPLGRTAVWQSNAHTVVPNNYSRWGFWESGESPYDMVNTALNAVKDSLNNRHLTPEFETVHDTQISDIIGRHGGLTVNKNGHRAGSVDFQYDNNWGRGPNTDYISSGALSEVDWNVDGQYNGLLVLTPPVADQTPSTLYIFVKSKDVAQRLHKIQGVQQLYNEIRAGMPGVSFAIHAIGDVTDAKGSGSDSKGKSVDVTVGAGGGIRYSVLGNPSSTDVLQAKELMNILGKPAVKSVGFGYPASTKSGSGLDYYLSSLVLMTADKTTVLDTPGQDVGVLDRVGIPSLENLE